MIAPNAWPELSKLFDQVSGLSYADRKKVISNHSLDDKARQWLWQMLCAYDAPNTSILDQTLGRIASLMAGDKLHGTGEIPEDISGMRFGNWRVTQKIASGAMAVVMHANRADGEYEQKAAIKLLLPGPYGDRDRQGLREELRLLARLEHPNIARLLDGGVSEQGWPYLVMEFVDGEHIDVWCRQQNLDLRQRLKLIVKVAAAVSYAHGRLVIHADIKPSNVMVNLAGEPKLVDFGIAGLLGQPVTAAQSGPSLLFRCSPAYASPEQLRGESPATFHDVYGLGALMYELLSGARIRGGRSVTAAILGHDTQDAIAPPSTVRPGILRARELRGAIHSICMKALAASTNDRYSSVWEFSIDLDRFLRGYPVIARKQGLVLKAILWLKRNTVAAIAIGSILTSLTIATALSFHGAETARASALRAEAINTFVLDMFATADPYANQQKPITVNNLVRRQTAKIDQAFSGQPRVRRDLLIMMAQVQGNLGNNQESLSLYQEALQLAENERAADVEIAQLHTGIAGQLTALGELDNALTHARSATFLAPISATPAAVAILAILEKASILNELRRNSDTMLMIEETLKYRQSILRLPEGEKLLGRLLAILSEQYGNIGKTDMALDLHAEAMKLYMNMYPDTHPEIAGAYARRATIHRAAGQFDQAVMFSLKSALLTRRALGSDHSQSLRNDTALVVDIAYLQCYRQATDLYGGIIERYRKTFGPRNVLTANALLSLASMRRKTGDNESGLTEINQTLDIYDSQAEPVTDMRAYALGIKAQLLFSLGQHQLAEDTSKQSLEAMRDAVGKAHPQTLRLQLTYGKMLRKRGRLIDAKKNVREAFDQLNELLGGNSKYTQDAALELALILRQEEDEPALEKIKNLVNVTDEQINARLDPATPEPTQCHLPDGVARALPGLLQSNPEPGI